METNFRWVKHDVYGLRLFFDISYSEEETCTKEEEFFPMEIDLPSSVLEKMVGQTIPLIPIQEGKEKWLREQLSELEHKQWERWSKHIAEELQEVYECINNKCPNRAKDKLSLITDKWSKNWKPYLELSKELKDKDRIWADKVLNIINKWI